MFTIPEELNVMIIVLFLIGIGVYISRYLELDFDIMLLGYLVSILFIFCYFMGVLPIIYGVIGFLLFAILLYISYGKRSEISESF